MVPIGFFAGLLRNLSSPSPRLGRPCPSGVSSRELLQRCNLPVTSYPIYQFPQSVLDFVGACRFGVMCWQHLHNRGTLISWSEGSVTPAFRHDVHHDFLPNPVHVAEVPDAPPNAPDEIRVGKSPPDFLPYNAREIGKNPRYRRHHVPDGC